MKIIFQYDGILPVKKYGGTERIQFWHMKELSKRGHQVILIADKKSQVEEFGITLIPFIPKSNEWQKLIPPDADIIHLQFNDNGKLQLPSHIPTISTIHGNGKIGEFFSENSVFVSKSHAYNHGSESYIYNALDLTEYPHPFANKEKFNHKKWEDFLFLGKASWKVKNLKSCVSAVIKSGKKIHVAGGRSFYPSFKIKNHGQVDQQKKIELFNLCDALLFPVLWPEPFGLVAIEAMSQGIPVIGTPYGALPEIIKKETGIIIKSKEELISILKKGPLQKFDPLILRKYVEDNFSIKNYTDQYIERYKQVIAGKRLNQVAPTSQLKSPAETLLPF